MTTDANPGEDQRMNKFFGAPIFRFKNRSAFLGILTFSVLAALIGILAFQRFLINKERTEQETYRFVEATTKKLQESLDQGMSATKTLSIFIASDGSVKNFDSVAALILNANPNVDVLQLLPGGVIQYMYPLKDNEKALGYNLLKDPTRNAEAFKAVRNNKIFYAGPLLLKQGGMAIVGRLPVFRNNRFWGFSAVIIRLSSLIREAGIDSAGQSGFYLQLSKINPQTNRNELFISPPKDVKFNNPVSMSMENVDWQVSAVPVSRGDAYADIVWLSLLGFLFSVMGGLIVYTMAKRPEKLDQLVKARTAALQESEGKYRSLIEHTSDGVVVFSIDGSIHQFNKAAYSEAGYPETEFAALNLKELLVDKENIMEPEKLGELAAGRKTTIEKQFYKKNGDIMTIEVSANLLPDGKFLALIRNITERQHTERALKASEEKYRSLIEQASDGIVIIDLNGTILEVNKSMCKMLGFAPEEMSGQPLSNFIPAADLVTQPLRFDELIEGKNLIYDRRVLKNDGTALAVQINSKMAGDQTMIGFIRDITQKKQAEELLVQSEKKYRSLIEQASDGIIMTNLSGTITEINRSFCLMGGYSVEELVGRHVDNFMPQEDITENPLRIADLVAGKSLRYERRMLLKDGAVIDVEINSKMANSNTLIGFVRDITGRKKAALEIYTSNERFELIAKATKDAIWDHDLETNITVGNENLYNLYGLTRGIDTITNEMFLERVHPDDRDRIRIYLQRAISERAMWITVEFRFKIADGTYKYFFDRAFIKYDEDSKPRRILGAMQDVTERTQNAQKLLKEKELSDSIINSLPALFFLFNIRGEFLRWNKNVEIITGYTPEEINNFTPLDFFDEDEKPIIKEKIEEIFTSGPSTVEANVLLKNGQKIPYYFSGMLIEYEGETCLMGFGLDFSDKVAADKRIKESEEKFRSLVEQASDGVVILTEDGRPLYTSPALQRILGYTEDEMMQLNLTSLTHPDDAEKIYKVWKKVMENPGVPIKGHSSRVLHKDGSWRWFEDTITNMLHVPSIRGIVENLRDVTEKLQIEQRIIAEKELSDSVINSLPGIFYLYDKSGRFIRWNKNFETITEYCAAEIRNMDLLSFYSEDEGQLIQQRIETNTGGENPGVELQLVTKGGKHIPFYINSLALEYEGLPCIMGMGFDVTDRKKIEQELVVSNTRLEQKATELKNSYTELERFAYIVSHDLQEPLRMVSSFLKLLEQKYKTQLDETGEKYIHFAVDGADRMKKLIMDLLEYSRTGTNKDIAADTDMNVVMTEVLGVLNTSIKEQNAVVKVGSLPVLPNTSKIQMFQLMQNLLGNALKYHGDNPPLVKINARESAVGWTFSIQDNGIGIDPKFSDKIFIIFQRLHSRNEFSGTGIGLSICKKIVEKHGGKIWVESEPGKGSTFYFSIPNR